MTNFKNCEILMRAGDQKPEYQLEWPNAGGEHPKIPVCLGENPVPVLGGPAVTKRHQAHYIQVNCTLKLRSKATSDVYCKLFRGPTSI